ncbi:MAG TPA: hypothetical protein VNH83_04375 [Bryobacteraceae bacterium]|nr:hypothetical protein [Bryobacteraceae bacterium]
MDLHRRERSMIKLAEEESHDGLARCTRGTALLNVRQRRFWLRTRHLTQWLSCVVEENVMTGLDNGTHESALGAKVKLKSFAGESVLSGGRTPADSV